MVVLVVVGMVGGELGLVLGVVVFVYCVYVEVG